MKCTRLLAFSTRSMVLALAVALGMGCGGGDSGDERKGGGGGVSAGGTGGTAGTKAGSGAGSGAGTTAGTTTAGTGTAGISTAGTTAGVGGDPTAGTGGGDNDVLPGEICDRISEIQCTAEVACCAMPRTYDACKADMMSGCSTMLYLDQIASNRITGFDAAAAKTAFTTYEAMAAACDPNVAEWGASITGLRSMIKGTVLPGKSCPIKASDSTATAAAALASCTDGATTACMFHSISGGSISFPINWTCDPRAGEGSKCFTDANCVDGLYCDNPDAKFSATCKPRKAAGTACEYPNECADLFCKKKVCVAKDQQSAYCLRND